MQQLMHFLNHCCSGKVLEKVGDENWLSCSLIDVLIPQTNQKSSQFPRIKTAPFRLLKDRSVSQCLASKDKEKLD